MAFMTKTAPPSRAGAWSAVAALTLCVSTLIASEFMPVSLLTPLASDLHLSEGQAGQAIAVSGVFAVLTSLFIASASRTLDRRALLLGLTALMLVSGLTVALAPSYFVLMAGRALLGVVIGGFWSMSTATVMRLVPEGDVPRALGLLNGGNALATTIAAPLGSLLGAWIGWRGAFFCVVPLAAITFAWQYLTLPAMPAREAASPAAAFRVLRRPLAPYGILAVTLLFMGQFALFTYLRSFLETVTRVDVDTLSLLLLVVGLAGLVGTWLIGLLLRTRLYSLLVAMPLAMAAVALGLIALGASTAATAILLALWGLIGTAAPVAWWTWQAKTLPEDVEASGGLMVAAIQLAITLGASAGGLLFDAGGYQATFAFAAAILVGSALTALVAARRAAPPEELRGSLAELTGATV
ncbi:MAG: MFS transporter [Alphaproteobacteria bacterium]|nr:MAG: MFS transporter [Alphaproteobacteria bacterium]